MCVLYPLLMLCFIFDICFSFNCPKNQFYRPAVDLKLVPLSTFPEEKVTFLTSSSSYRTCIEKNGTLRSDFKLDDDNANVPYQLCIAEEDDLPDVATLTVNAFGSDVITLSGQLSPLEKALLKPGIGLINSLDNSIAWVEVLSGLRARMRYRIEVSQKSNQKYNPEILLSPPPMVNVKDSEAQAIAAKSSLILVLARPSTDLNKKIDVVATVDVRLQPTDAKVPFSLPWVDAMERGFASIIKFEAPVNDLNLQPYISNLCVDESARGRKIGCAMVRCVERIVKDSWGYNQIYLHVDLDNLPAVKLYQNEGYEDLGSRWTPFWASNSATQIGYWCKKL